MDKVSKVWTYAKLIDKTVLRSYCLPKVAAAVLYIGDRLTVDDYSGYISGSFGLFRQP